MMAVTMDVFEAPMIERMKRFALVTNKSVGEAIRDRAPALARYLATATMPIAGLVKGSDGGRNPKGYTKAAETLGKRAVTRDIGRVYVSPKTITRSIAESNGEHGVAMAKGFTGFLKKGDLQSAKAILDRSGIAAKQLTIVQWDGGTAHRSARKQRGRVSENRKPSITTDAKALKQYSDMRRKNVGFAKGGWINAVKSMGGQMPKETPVWVSRHNSPGHGNDMTNDPTNPRYSLTNEVNYLSTILSESYLIRATESFDKSMRKEINIVCGKLARGESL
jgi:hypothetical protein